jgi:NarL family two-component system response regulator LiaR
MLPKMSHLGSPLQPNPVDGRSEIYVGLVMSHALAAHHLAELIKAHNMYPVILADGVKIANVFPARARVVIIIDLWGLPLPVARYLDSFTRLVPGVAFLALDQLGAEAEVAHLLRTGFAGFISHDQALHLLGSAITAVAEGQVWASPEVIRIYMNLTSQRTAIRGTGIETLTIRENQILDLLRRRYSNKEMANLLGISESTVKFHVSNVLTKLSVNDRRDVKGRAPFVPSRPTVSRLPSRETNGLPVSEEPRRTG